MASDETPAHSTSTTVVEIFTDGACSGNPGPGGWAAVLRWAGHEKTLSGWSGRTTNNRMELLAAIRALQALKKPCRVVLTTDSRYLLQGATEWMRGWKRRGWVTSEGKPVKNVDLWKAVGREDARHEIRWVWVKGHDEHPENERADRLAREAITLGLTGKIREDVDGRL